MKPFVLAAVLVAGVAAVQADEIVIPVVAWDAPGAATNTWTTEIYLSNTSGEEAGVLVRDPLPLKVVSTTPCLPPAQLIQVPAYTTIVMLASDLNPYLGCPTQFVGGLVLDAPSGLVVGTRMTNHKAETMGPQPQLLQGLSQEIPGVPREMLPDVGKDYMLPALGWHPAACHANQLDTYAYFANPGTAPLTVTLIDPTGSMTRLMVNRAMVDLPYETTVEAGRLVQMLVSPVDQDSGADCGQSAIFDLFFRTTAPVAALGSVVDHSTQDARTVLPAELDVQ